MYIDLNDDPFGVSKAVEAARESAQSVAAHASAQSEQGAATKVMGFLFGKSSKTAGLPNWLVYGGLGLGAYLIFRRK